MRERDRHKPAAATTTPNTAATHAPDGAILYDDDWDCDDDRQDALNDEPPYDHRLLHGDNPQ